MSEPTPADVPPQTGSKAAKGGPKVELLTVGHFRHRDHILGGEHDRFGVVVDNAGGRLAVYPLEHYTVQVEEAEFTPITPADFDRDETATP